MAEENRKLKFTEEEMAKIERCRQLVGCSYVEFVHHATMQACDEVLSDGP